ncbi:MAG: hypothetical protein JWN69_2111 [Alphaproteobacteria bacterium]|nr:hypothetical protein [Alphaproteobacteria bacterium]
MLFHVGGGRIAATPMILAALLGAAPALAGSFAVSPVNVELAPGQAGTEIRIDNADRAPVAVRVSLRRWTQQDGRDVAQPTRDVIASPPIFTLQPGARQLIRLGLRKRVPGAAYRVLIDEIPGPHAPGTGIKVALKLDLPFYVVASKDAKPALDWTARRDPAGNMWVEAHNSGALHSKVVGIEAQDAASHRLGGTTAMGVVLPASARRWNLGRIDGQVAQLVVRSPQGEQRSPVVVERP